MGIVEMTIDSLRCNLLSNEWALILKEKGDLPPEKESSFMLDWKIRKGATDGQKVLHTGADSQQAA